MDETREYYAKQSKSEKNKYHMISFICRIWNLRNKTKKKETSKQTLNCREQTDGYQRGGGWVDGLNR